MSSDLPVILCPGVLCVLIGCMVVLLDWLVPEWVREAFSVGGDDDDDDELGAFPHGYLNANFLEGVAIQGGLPAIGGEVLKSQEGLVITGAGVTVKGGGVNPATISELVVSPTHPYCSYCSALVKVKPDRSEERDCSFIKSFFQHQYDVRL